MMEKLYQILRELNEAIEYAELLDQAYTRHYSSLIRKRKIIERAIRQFEKADRRVEQW